MRRCLGLCVLLAALSPIQPIQAADITVMTQNQYLGADLTPLLSAPSPAMFNALAVATLQQVATGRPADRIQALAAEITEVAPDLVGLQEVVEFHCEDLATPAPGQGCDEPSIRGAFGDHLTATLEALNNRYSQVAIVQNFKLLDVPLSIDGSPIQVGVIDRDVILRRSDVEAAAVDLSPYCSKPSEQGCNYSTVLQVPNPLDPTQLLNVERGFVAVDATVEGKAYRFVATHLEEKHPGTAAAPVQAAQAGELIQLLQATTPAGRSLLVVGDTNSSPLDPLIFGSIPTPYMQFVEAGYTDAWLRRPGEVSGLTCCQPADLSNHNSVLYERVDMLFPLEAPVGVKQARVEGATVSDKTPPPGRGLWPSDHGAVSAKLQF